MIAKLLQSENNGSGRTGMRCHFLAITLDLYAFLYCSPNTLAQFDNNFPEVLMSRKTQQLPKLKQLTMEQSNNPEKVWRVSLYN